jgi:hypothetical protein
MRKGCAYCVATQCYVALILLAIGCLFGRAEHAGIIRIIAPTNKAAPLQERLLRYAMRQCLGETKRRTILAAVCHEANAQEA